MISEKIYKIAGQTRLYTERFAEQTGFPKNLSGCCFFGSRQLFRRLNRLNLKVGLAMSKYHCFVVYGKFIIDITATQFGNYPSILIKPRNNLWVWREKWVTYSWNKARKFDDNWQ